MIDQDAIRKKLPKAEREAKRTNASLWLNKNIQNYTQDESRKKLIEEVACLPEPLEYADYFKRWQETLTKAYGDQATRKAQVKGRMIVGLGGESVLETSICLHRTYGVPYIPGSALKGLAASYAHQRLGEEWQQGGKLHTIVFGKTEEAGYITFFDALYKPESGFGKRALHPDTITVHHPKYYQNTGAAPSDSDDPNPVPFLSATGIYLLALAAPDLPSPIKWIEITFQILAEALEQFGIGAKTSSGYGRMTVLGVSTKPGILKAPAVDPEIQRAEDIKRRLQALKESEIAGQIANYHRQWQQFTSIEARTLLAQAIIEKVRKAGREKSSAEKAWYKELLMFLGKE